MQGESYVCDAVSYVSKIFYLKERLDSPERRPYISTPYDVRQRLEFARRGSFISENNFEFSVSKPKRNEKCIEVVTLKIRPKK